MLALGVTGSGRELVGAALAACAGPDRVLILNEILAHAEGTLHHDPRAETVFEIGGQDAKYIRLAGGHVVDCALNEACSAGTGSFIEEQAVHLGRKMGAAGLSREGMGAPRGAGLGQHCSVFMAEAIDEASAAGIPEEEIVAGLFDSVARNYLHRVKGNREVGEVLYCQGMPFASDALAAAMARLTGRDVHVPPSPGMTGALGVALVAARDLPAGSDRLDLRAFLGSVVERRGAFTCRSKEGCGGSGNRCKNRNAEAPVRRQVKDSSVGRGLPAPRGRRAGRPAPGRRSQSICRAGDPGGSGEPGREASGPPQGSDGAPARARGPLPVLGGLRPRARLRRRRVWWSVSWRGAGGQPGHRVVLRARQAVPRDDPEDGRVRRRTDLRTDDSLRAASGRGATLADVSGDAGRPGSGPLGAGALCRSTDRLPGRGPRPWEPRLPGVPTELPARRPVAGVRWTAMAARLARGAAGPGGVRSGAACDRAARTRLLFEARPPRDPGPGAAVCHSPPRTRRPRPRGVAGTGRHGRSHRLPARRARCGTRLPGDVLGPGAKAPSRCAPRAEGSRPARLAADVPGLRAGRALPPLRGLPPRGQATRRARDRRAPWHGGCSDEGRGIPSLRAGQSRREGAPRRSS